VREACIQAGLSLVDQTKLVTAASELGRNTVIYGGGGSLQLEVLATPRRGVRLTFADNGPGIPDLELALRDGFTTGSGLGLGLGGAKRLVNEFEIDSAVGRGTRIVLTRWK
jgi:serine/threonine-protein kinase RsbT